MFWDHDLTEAMGKKVCFNFSEKLEELKNCPNRMT